MQPNSYRGRHSQPFLKSNCDGVYCNGTAAQIVEKWQAHSNAARASGDLVAAERFGQQAEHYRRIQSV